MADDHPDLPGPDLTHDLAWTAARLVAAQCVSAVPVSTVGLAHAAGAVLAADALARTDLPPRDASAMDGWAIAGPPPWRQLGTVLAGQQPGDVLAAGQALAVATGATLPTGATGVLRREWGALDADGVVQLLGPAPVAGIDIRPAGQECRRGDVVLPAGTRVRPAALGLLAAAGIDEVAVRRVSADVLVLGDELLTRGPARDGRVRDALGPLLSAWLPAWGIGLSDRAHVPDDHAALRTALSGCRGDLVVTTGSTARGPVDHLHAVLADVGAELVVDGVAVRPGHPMLLARLPDGRPLIGLPGNPLAAVSGLLTLLAPVVTAMTGLAAAPSRLVRLAEAVGAGEEATRLLPVRDGRPVHHVGPGMLRGLAAAEGVAVIPPGGVAAGGQVELLEVP